MIYISYVQFEVVTNLSTLEWNPFRMKEPPSHGLAVSETIRFDPSRL